MSCTNGSVCSFRVSVELLTQVSSSLCKVTNTGQLNTILTFYEISDPPVPSALSGIPDLLLRSAISVLTKSGRAQLISISDGDGVRFFPPRSSK